MPGEIAGIPQAVSDYLSPALSATGGHPHDILSPALKLFLGKTILAHDFVLELFLGAGYRDGYCEPSVFRVAKADFDRRLAGQIGG